MYVTEEDNFFSIHESSEILNTYPASLGLEQIIRRILEDYDFGGDFMDKEKDVEFLVEGVKKKSFLPVTKWK